MSTEPEKRYRYYDYRVAGMAMLDEDSTSSHAAAYLQEFDVISKTPQGCWVRPSFHTLAHPKSWVSDKARKKLCYADKAEAWASFLARKKRQASILQAQLKHVHECLSLSQP